MRPILLSVLLLSPALACAQTVYKCTDASGTVVFSQRPCAEDPDKVQTVDTSRAMRTGSGGSVAEEGEFAQLNEVRRRCQGRSGAISDYYAAQYKRIAREIETLEDQIRRASGNLAGATWESGLRQQISGLIGERATLKTAEVNEQADNRERCREEEKTEIERQAAARQQRSAGSDPKTATTPADTGAKAAPADPGSAAPSQPDPAQPPADPNQAVDPPKAPPQR